MGLGNKEAKTKAEVARHTLKMGRDCKPRDVGMVGLAKVENRSSQSLPGAQAG